MNRLPPTPPAPPKNTGSGKEAVSAASVEVWQSGALSQARDRIAGEVPVALVYNGISHAVMMATPRQLEDFALGFSMTEAIVDSPDEVFDIEVEHRQDGIEVQLTLSGESFARLKGRRRSLTGRTGCGLCGAESLQQVRLPLAVVNTDCGVSHNAVDRAVRSLAEHQPMQAETGAMHGAAWCDSSGRLLEVREDVGRHNALDKLIGSLARQGCLDGEGFLLISSRASYEMVQKAVMANIGIIVAVSAPTGMAIATAEQANVTLVGFARRDRHVAYTHGQRLG